MCLAVYHVQSCFNLHIHEVSPATFSPCWSFLHNYSMIWNSVSYYDRSVHQSCLHVCAIYMYVYVCVYHNICVFDSFYPTGIFLIHEVHELHVPLLGTLYTV